MNKEQITKRCRWLRRNQTKSEEMFWQQVRNRKINNLKFLRQHPFIYQVDNYKLYYFIGDFYCAEKKIIIELDGKIHDEQKEYDESRDMTLKGLNLKVVRFKNHEIEKAVEFVKSL